MEQREELNSFSGECFMEFIDVVLRDWRVSQELMHCLLELPNR